MVFRKIGLAQAVLAGADFLRFYGMMIMKQNTLVTSGNINMDGLKLSDHIFVLLKI